MVRVLDDLFTDKFLLETYEQVMTEVNWTYDNMPNRYQYPYNDIFGRGEGRFFGSMLYYRISNHFFENKLPSKVMEAFEWLLENNISHENLFLERVNANLVVKGIDGATHVDDYFGNGIDRTILWYPHYRWEKEWGGELQILDNDDKIIEEFLPLPGRAICFDASIRHRFVGPSVPDIPRISIAFRMRAL